MKRYMLALLFAIALPTWADVNLESLLNKVSLQLEADRWVTTQTALVQVVINATVTDQSIESIQAQVMQKLSQLSNKGEWHVVSLNRALDKAGLENIQIHAEARLPQTELGMLRSHAKTLSKPGETFTIDNVLFVPSEEERRAANMELRAQLYQQAKLEIENLNKIYPDQKYYLHQIDFITSLPTPVPMMATTLAVNAEGGSARSTASLPVGNKVNLQATVVLASMPEVVAQKIMNAKPQ